MKKCILLSAIVFLSICAILKAQNIEFLSSFFYGGHIRSLKVENDMAFIGAFGSMRILSLSNASHPNYIGGCILEASVISYCEAIEVEWTAVRKYAYVTTGSIFQIVDISDPWHPTIISEITMPFHAHDLYYRYPYVYVVTGAWLSPGGPMWGYLHIIEVTNPEEPRVAGSYQWGNVMNAIWVEGDYAFAGCHTGLMIFDISDPSNPLPIRGYGTGSSVEDVLVEDGYAYLAAATAGLIILDVTDPYEPVPFSQYSEDSFFELCKFDTLLYLTTRGQPAIKILSVSDLSDPYIIGEYWASPFVFGIVATDTLLYIGDYFSGLQTLDVRNPENPKLVDLYRTHVSIEALYVQDDYAYVGYLWYTDSGDFQGGLQVVHVADPENPVLMGSCHLSKPPRNLFVLGDYAYVADGFGGLIVIDAKDPYEPEIVATVPMDYVSDLLVSGEYAYVNSYGDLIILDISDPADPEILSTCPAPENFSGMAKSGNYLFLGGIMVFDVSNPYFPSRVSTCIEHGEYQYGIAVRGNYIYQTDSEDGINIFDVSDPHSPYLAGNYPSSGAWGIEIADSYLYFCSWTTGLHILDIADPVNPVELDHYSTFDQSWDLAVSGDNIIMSETFSMLSFLWAGPSTTTAAPISMKPGIKYTNYPNPFNTSATIEFTIPEAQNIKIAVYDILGRQIRILCNGHKQAGKYALNFDASDLSSGVYFYRLQSGKTVETKRMLLLK